MKISQMTNNQASEALIRLSSPLANILDDENTKPLLEDMEKLGTKGIVSQWLPKFVAYCLKDHKADVYEIIGALTFKPTKVVGNMNFLETVKELKESIDEDLIGFFKSSGNATATPGEE